MSKTASGIVMLLKYYFIADVREGKLNLKTEEMKKIKVIQYAMMFIALWTTLYLIDSIEVSKKEFIAAFVLVTVVSVNYICFRYYEDRKQNKDSL